MSNLDGERAFEMILDRLEDKTETVSLAGEKITDQDREINELKTNLQKETFRRGEAQGKINKINDMINDFDSIECIDGSMKGEYDAEARIFKKLKRIIRGD